MKFLQKAIGYLVWLCLFAVNVYYVHGFILRYLEAPVGIVMFTRPIMARDEVQITFGM